MIQVIIVDIKHSFIHKPEIPGIDTNELELTALDDILHLKSQYFVCRAANLLVCAEILASKWLVRPQRRFDRNINNSTKKNKQIPYVKERTQQVFVSLLGTDCY
jgi:hypothetical protein